MEGSCSATIQRIMYEFMFVCVCKCTCLNVVVKCDLYGSELEVIKMK